MRGRCGPISATPAARGEGGLTERMASHAADCTRCRDELADHRALAAEMRSLRSVVAVAPREIYPRVMDDIGPWSVPEPGGRPSRRPIVAAVAAVATAAVTAAAGTAVLVVRHRHHAA